MAAILVFGTSAERPDGPPPAAEGGADALLSALGPAALGDPVGATSGWPPPASAFAPDFSAAALYPGSAAEPAALLDPQAFWRNQFPGPQAADFFSAGEPVASLAGGGGGSPFAAPSLDVQHPSAEVDDRSSVGTTRAARRPGTGRKLRKAAELTPDELKALRRRSNLSSNGYREKQKARFAELEGKNKRLTAENYFLRQQVAELAARVLELYGHPVAVFATEPFREKDQIQECQTQECQTQECHTRSPVSTPPPLAGPVLPEQLDGRTGQERLGETAANQDLLDQFGIFPEDVPECSDGRAGHERRDDVAAGDQDLLTQLSVFPLELQRELCGLFTDAGQADAANESAGAGAHLFASDFQSNPDGPAGPVEPDPFRQGSPVCAST